MTSSGACFSDVRQEPQTDLMNRTGLNLEVHKKSDFLMNLLTSEQKLLGWMV